MVIPYDNKLSLSDLDLEKANEDRGKKVENLTDIAGIISLLSVTGGVVSALLLIVSTTAGAVGITFASLGLLSAGILVCVAFADPRIHYEDEMVAEQILLDLANDKLANVVWNYDISKLRRYGYIDAKGAHVLRRVATAGSWTSEKDEKSVESAQKRHFREPRAKTTAEQGVQTEENPPSATPQAPVAQLYPFVPLEDDPASDGNQPKMGDLITLD